MRQIIMIWILSLPHFATGMEGVDSDSVSQLNFSAKVYTPEIVVDRQNEGAKGAVQLLWQKSNDATRYEVEVSNGRLIYSQVGEKHFHHIMLYFDKDYQWRVREVSANRTTEFTPWMPLKVVRGDRELAHDRNQNSHEEIHREPDVDQFLLDTGE